VKDTDIGALPDVVLLATDGSEASASAARVAAKLSIANGSELHVVHAVSTKPKPPYPHFWEKEQIEDLNDRKRVAALALLEEKTGELTRLGAEVAGSHYREGRKPAQEVARLAEEIDADLVVTGGRKSGLLVRVLLPDFAELLYRRVRRATLIVGTPRSRGDRILASEEPSCC
jgi:nucleotide-binding universal stress UspA family protein